MTSPGTVQIDLAGPLRGRQRCQVAAARQQLAQLFGAADVPARIGYGPVPPGHRVVESWRVLPGPADPRFLVPLDPAVARRVLVSHNRLRSGRVRWQRRAAALAVGPLRQLHGERSELCLSVPEEVSPAGAERGLITRRMLSTVPGAEHTAISLQRFHPRAKPTVQLVGGDGRIVAFAKIATDPVTAQRVERESDLLRRLGEGLNGPVRLPAVLGSHSDGPVAYSVAAPLPERARGAVPSDEPRILQRLKIFQEALGTRVTRVGDTDLWQELERLAQRARGATERPDLVQAHARLLEFCRTGDAELDLPAGCLHGDWVPWNMAWEAERLWVWDLEYGSPLAPLGLDALRWTFQLRHALAGSSLVAAVGAMAAAAPRVLPEVGIDPDSAPTLIRLHLLELLGSALALLAAGRGLPPGLDPDAARVLREWEER
ncbi:MAG: phosphotransferase [Actinomycetota bacterium]|nr:phosphotransferase [Actinomycetota bacterium]